MERRRRRALLRSAAGSRCSAIWTSHYSPSDLSSFEMRISRARRSSMPSSSQEELPAIGPAISSTSVTNSVARRGGKALYVPWPTPTRSLAEPCGQS